MTGEVRRDSAAAQQEQVDPQWFREPTPREHRIAALLFVGFGVFFALLFVVLNGWWFRWVILSLAGVSVLYGLGHARDLWRRATSDEPREDNRHE
jgi:hypothetical protein